MAATHEMVIYCFDALYSKLNGHHEPEPAFNVDVEFPFFVTWEKENKLHADSKELRGCIGTLSPTSLRRLKDYAYKSALQDSRFNPIHHSELPLLHCSVSLLVNYEEAKHYKDWVIGTHGIVIVFEDEHNHSYSATYLPEVAWSQGWNHEETLESLMKKAGYRKQVTIEMMKLVNVTRYQSSKIKLSYKQYMEYKTTI